MMGVIFRKIGGRIIPLNFSQKKKLVKVYKAGQLVTQAATLKQTAFVTAGSIAAMGAIKSNDKIKENKTLRNLGFALSAGSGLLSAATFYSKPHKFILANTLGLGLDMASIGLVGASVVGKGNKKERIKKGIRLEAQNNLIGYGALGAGLLAHPRTLQIFKAMGTRYGGF